MDVAALASTLIAMQTGLTQSNLGVAMLRMNAQTEASMAQLVESAAQQGRAASLPPGVGQNLNITV